MSIGNNIRILQKKLATKRCKLLAVTKSQPLENIQAAYHAGQRSFGENRVQELVQKWEVLPKDIEWHMIGHLQTNKVKYIAPFISLIHAVDSYTLLREISKQGYKLNRTISCLLQVKIAEETSKFGMLPDEVRGVLDAIDQYPFVSIKGLMGMATFTRNEHQVKEEFDRLRKLYEQLKKNSYDNRIALRELSMGMSSDYHIALNMGSTIVRIGTAIFSSKSVE